MTGLHPVTIRKYETNKMQPKSEQLKKIADALYIIDIGIFFENDFIIDKNTKPHRLIQLGALAEKYLHCTNIEPEDFEKLLKQIVETKDVNMILHSNKVEETDKN